MPSWIGSVHGIASTVCIGVEFSPTEGAPAIAGIKAAQGGRVRPVAVTQIIEACAIASALPIEPQQQTLFFAKWRIPVWCISHIGTKTAEQSKYGILLVDSYQHCFIVRIIVKRLGQRDAMDTKYAAHSVGRQFEGKISVLVEKFSSLMLVRHEVLAVVQRLQAD